jgi:hypothetical protein
MLGYHFKQFLWIDKTGGYIEILSFFEVFLGHKINLGDESMTFGGGT